MNTCIIFIRDEKYEFSYFFVQTHFPVMGYVLLSIPKMGKRHSDVTFSSMKGYDNIFPSWEFYLNKTCFPVTGYRTINTC